MFKSSMLCSVFIVVFFNHFNGHSQRRYDAGDFCQGNVSFTTAPELLQAITENVSFENHSCSINSNILPTVQRHLGSDIQAAPSTTSNGQDCYIQIVVDSALKYMYLVQNKKDGLRVTHVSRDYDGGSCILYSRF